jgi:hypothetical protein
LDLPVDKDHFIEFNRRLIQEKGLHITRSILATTPIRELAESLTVMVYFANLVYDTGHGPLYQEDTPLYSLSTLPTGTLSITEEETPPLYDLVVAHAVLYTGHLPSKEEILSAY